MAMYMSSILLMGLIFSAFAADSPHNDLLTMIEEMQTANYFTFVMLVKMSQARIPSDVTFLMPSDRMLSKVSLSNNAITEFLMRHSIPSPLLFDHLKLLPTGSTIPTNEPGYMLRVSNNGRRNFYLNNVKVISPNICTAGSSIRCHGINGVLTGDARNTTVPPPACSSDSPHIAAAPTTLSQPLPPPMVGPLNLTPVVAPPPTDLNPKSNKSGCSDLLSRGLSSAITRCVMLLLMGFLI